MFEKATRQKLRFPLKGHASVEDLWDAPLTTLDTLYQDLNRTLKETQVDSLLGTRTRTKETQTLELQTNIIRHIVKVRLEEIHAKESEAVRIENKRKIQEIIAKKQDEGLLGKSLEELQSMVDSM